MENERPPVGLATLRRALVGLSLAASSLSAESRSATATAVRHKEGIVHGYLAVKTPGGETLADGDLFQTSRGDEVTSRLVFHFKDGSSHDETVVFSQRRVFRVLSYRLVQKGPTFPRPLELSIDARSGLVTVKHVEDSGEKIEKERLDLPPDLANGIVPVILKNGRPEAPPTMSLLAATPKPRLVKLEATRAGEESFEVAGGARKAVHYVIKVEIGGLAGLVAPLLGKQPPETHVYIQSGEVPGFVRADGPLFLEGPIWRVELAGPSWPRAPRE